MKGIILAAGKGTRLYPMTYPTAKCLLPVYDKPMIYYPLTTMIKLGITDILMIVDSENKLLYKQIFGDGSKFGVSISYMVQYTRRGIADAFILAEEFIGQDNVTLILGDNLFLDYNDDWMARFRAEEFESGAVIAALRVKDPQRFGVVQMDSEGHVISLEEKPEHPKSDMIVPGLYVYDNQVIEIAKQVKPSARGELEITSINQAYLENEELVGFMIPCDWYDTGTADSLLAATLTVRKMNESQYLGMPEVAAHQLGLITDQQYLDSILKPENSEYAEMMKRYADTRCLKAKSQGLI